MAEPQGMLGGERGKGALPFAFPDTPYGRWQGLEAQRQAAPGDVNLQSMLAPKAHEEWMRHQVSENPAWVVPGLYFTPIYTTLKALGMLPSDETTSKPSLDTVAGGYRGVWKGLGDFFK